jgi:hypothetical protein
MRSNPSGEWLFKQKNRVEYVGVRLWRLGFQVDEKFWRSRLKRAGRIADRVAFLLPAFVERFDRDASAITFFESAAVSLSKADDIVLSRIKGRVEVDRLPAFVRAMEEVGRGDFVGFGHVVPGDEDISGHGVMVDALDLQPSERDLILGRKLNLLALLPTGLRTVSKAISKGRFAAIADRRPKRSRGLATTRRMGFSLASTSTRPIDGFMATERLACGS